MECWANDRISRIHFSFDVIHYSIIPVFQYDFTPNFIDFFNENVMFSSGKPPPYSVYAIGGRRIKI